MSNKMFLASGTCDFSIEEISAQAREKAKLIGEENVYNFSIGNPSLASPKPLNDELIRLINEYDPVKLHSYTPSVGLDESREKIVAELNQRFKTDFDYHYMMLTPGASPALVITFQSLIESSEDEVILMSPFFPEYTAYLEDTHAKIVICPPDEKFAPDFNELEKLISPKTRIVLIDTPNNPSGKIYSDSELKQLASLLREKEIEYGHPIYLVNDEPYREIRYNDDEYHLINYYYDDSIINYSYSKSLSIPGERMGYILISPKCANKDEIFTTFKGASRDLGYFGASSLYQIAIANTAGLTNDFTPYKEHRDLIYNMLTELGYECVYPDGAFYLFVKALEDDDMAFCEKAKKYNLYLCPSTPFGVKGYVRICYCCTKETIINSKQSFKSLMEDYQK